MAERGRDDDERPEPAVGGRTVRHDIELQTANDLLREDAGRVAFELATTPEGRAVGLSVEVGPHRGVGLRVRKGHELRVFIEPRDHTPWVMWARVDPGQRGGRSKTSHGNLGPWRRLGPEDVRAFMTRWLACRTQG